MKQVFHSTLSLKWLVVSLLVGLFSYVVYSMQQVVFNESEYSYNRYLIPLGNRQAYTIKWTQTENQGGYYYIQPDNETESTAHKTGFAVGRSAIDLAPFLEQKVYIYGIVKKGYVVATQSSSPAEAPERVTDNQFSTEQMVVQINAVRSAE